MAATAREYASRQAKAARFAAHFHAHSVSSELVSRMGLHAPEWAQLAASISRESGRKLLPPHSQETIDAICENLRYYEQAKSQQVAETDIPFDFRMEAK